MFDSQSRGPDTFFDDGTDMWRDAEEEKKLPAQPPPMVFRLNPVQLAATLSPPPVHRGIKRETILPEGNGFRGNREEDFRSVGKRFKGEDQEQIQDPIGLRPNRRRAARYFDQPDEDPDAI